MDAGRLRNRIKWGVYEEVQDGAGGTSWEITNIRWLWANVRYVSGQALLANNVEVNREIITVVCRYNASIPLNGVLLVDGKEFQVESIAPTSERDFMTITAEVNQ